MPVVGRGGGDVTLDECCRHIGDGVVYMPGPWDDAKREDGTITSTNAAFAFVRFAGDTGSKACRPEDLTLLYTAESEMYG